jgi:hypothetical protein
MKYLFMILSTVMWLGVGFALTHTLYPEGGSIGKGSVNRVLIETGQPTGIVMHVKRVKT